MFLCIACINRIKHQNLTALYIGTTMEYKLQEEVHHCLQCGSQIYGRKDKRFCTTLCKNNYNNYRKSLNRSPRQNKKEKLSKNHRILEMLISERIKNISLSVVELLGFDLDYSSAIIRDTNGKKIYKCLNIQYRLSKRRVYDIKYVITTTSPCPSRDPSNPR